MAGTDGLEETRAAEVGASPAPPTETVEGPASKGAAPVPDFLFKDDKPSPPTSATENQQLIESNDIIVDTIALVHEAAVERTGYQGFAFTERLGELWRKILRFALKKMPVKDWPIIVCAGSLILAYGMMVVGYMKWRRGPEETDHPTPTKAPSEAVESEIPIGVYGA